MAIEHTEAEIAEANKIGQATGMGEPDLNAPGEAEEATLEEKQPNPKPTEPKPKADDNDLPEEDKSKKDDVEGDESDDEENSEEANRHSRTDKAPARTVPYDLLKAERTKTKNIQAQVEALARTVEELRNGKLTAKEEEQIDEIEATAEQLSEGTDADPAFVAKILREAVKLTEKKYGNNVPKEVQDRLKVLDEIEKREKQSAEASHFEQEFQVVASDLKKQYPNATDTELAQAKALLDQLAHSKEFHKYELDYVIYKNKSKFDTILKVAPKAKGGEAGKVLGPQQEYDQNDGDEEHIPDIEDMTPELMKAREAKSMSGRESSPKDYRIQHPIR